MTTCGTPYWTAPEILLGHVYNESVDTYSYGMVLWELWTCETPFQGMPAMEVAVQVASGEPVLFRICCLTHGLREIQFRVNNEMCDHGCRKSQTGCTCTMSGCVR
eukprot:SAG31_NODE_3092_length_4683_cov_2.003927_2_plen_105_part_00